MKNSILGLRTVIYLVPDMQAARKWYIEAFGVEPYFDESFYIGFEIGGYELGLFPEYESQKRGDNVEAYWGVEDIEAEHQRFLKLGAMEHTPIKDVGGNIKVTTLMDPWGNLIGLIYNPNFQVK